MPPKMIWTLQSSVEKKPPSRPQGPIKVLSTTKTSATIEWRAPEDDGGLPLSAYVLEKREFPRSTWSRVDKISPDMTSNTIQNLTTGSDYFFRVMAENKAGPSPPLEMDKPVRIKSPYVVPEPPTGPVYFSHLDATSVVLDWRAPRDDGGAPVLNYRIEVSQNQETWTEVTIVDGDLTKTKAKNLATDKKHYFRIFAINKVGTSKPLESDAVTPKRPVGPPGKPVGPLEAKAITRDSVQLDWKPPQDDGGLPITGYIIEKREAMRMTWSRADKTTDDEDTGGTCHWR
ncbi:immunoglobulin-like and fibronectin type III domain-containing protein 1 isoform X1 [Littorina saxatilis]|uniref:immunoglobulin-like and fibronectin type III domain-containing protein 1 isoform X1 n=1 Tax=Littorina saxatilis TaxID=31220 RepID=UPI0038B4F6E3